MFTVNHWPVGTHSALITHPPQAATITSEVDAAITSFIDSASVGDAVLGQMFCSCNRRLTCTSELHQEDQGSQDSLKPQRSRS